MMWLVVTYEEIEWNGLHAMNFRRSFRARQISLGRKRKSSARWMPRMGDGDLGLTMQKGFGALPQLIRDK